MVKVELFLAVELPAVAGVLDRGHGGQAFAVAGGDEGQEQGGFDRAVDLGITVAVELLEDGQDRGQVGDAAGLAGA